MPLDGFFELKKKVLDEQYTEPLSLGTMIQYVPIGGQAVSIQAHVEAKDSVDVDFHTESDQDQVLVQIRKEDLGDTKPKLNDKVIHEGRVYYNTGQMTDDGSSFWRIQFQRDHVYTKGLSGGE